MTVLRIADGDTFLQGQLWYIPVDVYSVWNPLNIYSLPSFVASQYQSDCRATTIGWVIVFVKFAIHLIYLPHMRFYDRIFNYDVQ